MSKKETVEQAKKRKKLESLLKKEYGIEGFMLIGLNKENVPSIVFSEMAINNICYCAVSLQEFSMDRIKGIR